MGNTSIARRSGAAVAAFVIFVVGAGIGWQLASHVFPGEAPVPTLAAIQFENAQPRAAVGREAISTQGPETVQPAPIPQAVENQRRFQHNVASGPSEEERYLAAALHWAEKYRERQEAAEQETRPRRHEMQKLAAAEGWTEVTEHAQGFGHDHEDVQQVVQAQVEREDRLRKAELNNLGAGKAGQSKVANAAKEAVKMPLAGESANAVVPSVEVRAENCTHACENKGAHSPSGAAKRPAARRRDRGANNYTQEFMCPLGWLEPAVWVDLGVGEREGRRHNRDRVSGQRVIWQNSPFAFLDNVLFLF